LLAINPRIVYLSLTAHGSSGPDAERGGFDITSFYARSGILGLLTRQTDAPPRSRSGQGDHITTLVMMTGLLAALRQRDRTGRGQVVETSLLAVGAYTIGEDLLRKKLGLEPRAANPLNAYYKCADDRWLRLAVPDHLEAESSTGVLEALNTDSIEQLAAVFVMRNRADWGAVLDSHRVAWTPVQTLPEMVRDPVVQQAGVLGTISLPDFGDVGIVTAPYKLLGLPVRDHPRGPDLGEHTREVLDEFEATAGRES
jgi:formyl-CoA transferase